MEASPPGRTSWWGMSAGGLHCHYCSHGIADVLWSACRWFFKKLPGSQMAAFWPFERTFKTSCDKMCPRNWNQPMQLLALHKSNPSLHLFRQQLLNHPSPACNKLRTPAPLERSKSPKQTQWLGGAVGIKFWDWGPLKSKQEAHIEAYSKTPTSDKIILKKLSKKWHLQTYNPQIIYMPQSVLLAIKITSLLPAPLEGGPLSLTSGGVKLGFRYAWPPQRAMAQGLLVPV